MEDDIWRVFTRRYVLRYYSHLYGGWRLFCLFVFKTTSKTPDPFSARVLPIILLPWLTFPPWRWTHSLPSPAWPPPGPQPFPLPPSSMSSSLRVETLALETDLLLSAVLLLAVIRNQVQHHPESQSFMETCLSPTMAQCCSVAHTLWATWVYMITEDAVNVVSMEKNAVCVPVSCRWSCCSVAKSCLTLWPHELQHAELSCPSLTFKKGKLYGIHTQLIHHSDFPWNCTYTLHNQDLLSKWTNEPVRFT